VAVYTDVSDDDVAVLVARYDIGAPLSFRGIAEGVENTNYILHTEKAEFILTLYERRVDPEDLPFFLDLLDFLNGRGIACPAPVHDRDGVVLQAVADRPAALFTFLEGLWIRRPKVRHCAELGRALAGFHLASEDFPGRRENALAIAGWERLVDDCVGRADTVLDGLAGEIETELEELSRLWPRGLPEGVIHADLFPDNVFFIGDRISGLIDFYFACTDKFAYDVAICLNSWCFEPDHSFNVTKGRAFIEAYRTVRPFRPGEFDALPVLARGAAFRFLLTRLYDWLNTPAGALVKPKDPLEYWLKLRFHRTMATTAEYGL
jgi:homoserine kinase type II